VLARPLKDGSMYPYTYINRTQAENAARKHGGEVYQSHWSRRVFYVTLTPMTTLKALETSLYWMTYVYKQTLDPVQRERVKTRIAKLEAEIAAHEDNQKVAP
jgi:hypothetical protein